MNLALRSWLIARTLPRLGLRNVAAVAAHRVGKRMGLHDRPAGDLVATGPFFPQECLPAPRQVSDSDALLRRARAISEGALEIFGDRTVELGVPFDWSRNVLPHGSCEDIKGVWEASRFGWATDLARAHRLRPQEGFRDCLELYTADWLARHPAYAGPNWNCGQEASIRLLHLLLASRILSGRPAISAPLVDFTVLHLERIGRTLHYAVAQENNHATSEAAALFIGGSVVLASGNAELHDRARRWQARGRRALEHALATLVLPDGGFAQYSVNYHRVLIDTLAQVELWRSDLGEPEFSDNYRKQSALAVRWLGAVINAETGAVPNIGHNDGAQVYRLTDRPFADYRPTLSLACALLLDRVPPAPAFDGDPLVWLGIEPPGESERDLCSKHSRLFPAWGMALLNARSDGSGSYAFIRFPVRGFRPTQADMLHFDLWTRTGRNLLLDAGSFSYAEPEGAREFAAIAAHNTLAFDRSEPMRRVGRFLYADWLDAEDVAPLAAEDDDTAWSVAYRDRAGRRHRRSVRSTGTSWLIEDRFDGFDECAQLRWHLPLQHYRLEGTKMTTEGMGMIIDVEGEGAVRVEQCWISPTYGRRDRALVLVAEVGREVSRIVTRIELAD